MERERQAREKDEAAMAASMQNNKKKLLNDLAEEEAKREDAVRNLQQMKDKEKEGLITSLSNGKTFTTSQRTAFTAWRRRRRPATGHLLFLTILGRTFFVMLQMSGGPPDLRPTEQGLKYTVRDVNIS